MIEQAAKKDIIEKRYKRDKSKENEEKMEEVKQTYEKRLKEVKELTEKEKEEKKELLKHGFPDWNTKDFQLFIKLSSTYGRDNISQICKHLKGKTESEVVDYHKTFWSKYKEMRDWKKFIASIEEGINFFFFFYTFFFSTF